MPAAGCEPSTAPQTPTGLRPRLSRATLVLLLAACASEPDLPGVFNDDLVIAGLELPTTHRFARDGSVFVAEKRGLRSPSATAGQGGTTEVAIALTREATTAAGFAVDTSVEVETTVTVAAIPQFLTISAMGGFTIGMGAGRTLRYTTGKSTEYVGRVGSIPSGEFGYSFGLFTYIHDDAATGQEFEVLNYWVQP